MLAIKLQCAGCYYSILSFLVVYFNLAIFGAQLLGVLTGLRSLSLCPCFYRNIAEMAMHAKAVDARLSLSSHTAWVHGYNLYLHN